MTKEIKLTQGKVALVDDNDYEWLNSYRWYAAKNGHNFYAVRVEHLGYINGKQKVNRIIMHRLITDAKNGLQVDHRDGNGLNNQKENLRICTKRQNGQNQKHRKNKSSIFPGVCWSKNNEKWVAGIRINGKSKYLGCFEGNSKGEKIAAKAYERACRELGTELICKT